MTTRALLLAGAFAAAALVPAAAQGFPKTPPPPAAVTPAPFPPIQEATLPNGLRIMVVENRKQPLVSVSLSFAAGGVHDPAGKEGLAEMVAGLLTKGAGTRSAEAIAETIEGTGGSLSATAGSDFLTVTANVLTPSLPLAFELLGDVVVRPTFPAEELELLRTQTLSGLQVQLSQPDAIASRAFRRAVYGDHPYGRSETPASVGAIAREDLVAFHRDRLRPGGALLVLAGDVNLDEARRLATRTFQGWTGSPAGGAAPPVHPSRSGAELLLVHRPGSVQSNILVGNLTFGPADPRQYAASLANRVLGGGADSRLFLILREEKGWTYGSYSSVARRRGTGFFIASAEVRTEVTDSALNELLAQLRRIGREPVPAEELEAARGAMVGSYPLSIETAEQVADAVANARLYGLPDDYVQTYRVRLAGLTAAEVQAAARAVVRPDSAVIVVVGDGAKVYQGIKDVAPIRIVDPEGKPLSPDIFAARAAALEFDPARLRLARDSFDIVIQGNTLGYLVSGVERTEAGFRYTESTRLAGFVQQDTEVLTDAGFRPLRVTQSGTVQGERTSIDVTFTGGRATGSATTPGPGGMQSVTIDTAVAAGVLDDNQVQPVLSALAWGPDVRWTFPVFSSGSGEERVLTLAVTGTDAVTTAAGAAQCYRVEVTGGPQPVTFWVTVEGPPRVMKIALAGTPVEMYRAGGQ